MEPWLVWAVGIVGAILGSGGVASLVKARSDARRGVRETEISGDTALGEQWRTLLEAQTKALLDPLTEQVSTLRAEVVVLRDRVNTLEREGRESARREELLWNWADVLVEHVNSGKGPPAPTRPEGLHR